MSTAGTRLPWYRQRPVPRPALHHCHRRPGAPGQLEMTIITQINTSALLSAPLMPSPPLAEPLPCFWHLESPVLPWHAMASAVDLDVQELLERRDRLTTCYYSHIKIQEVLGSATGDGGR